MHAHTCTCPELPPYLQLKVLLSWQPSAEIEANLIYLAAFSIFLSPPHPPSSLHSPPPPLPYLCTFMISLLTIVCSPRFPLSNHANAASKGRFRCLATMIVVVEDHRRFLELLFPVSQKGTGQIFTFWSKSNIMMSLLCPISLCDSRTKMLRLGWGICSWVCLSSSRMLVWVKLSESSLVFCLFKLFRKHLLQV